MSTDRKAYQKAYYEKNKDKIKLQIKLQSKCAHGKIKAYCKECGGSQICEHRIRKNQCKVCDLPKYLINLQRINLKRVLKLTNIEKTKPSIEYLDCSAEYFQNFIQSKMTEGMTWDNIHLDHIKPVDAFDLENHEEFLDCCHYSNFQPLFAKDNLEKNNKWNKEAEAFWNENIKGKEYLKIFIPQ